MSAPLEEFLTALAARDIHLWVEAGTRLRYRGPKGALTPELGEELRQRKDAILALLAASAAPEPIPRLPAAATYALSQAQWRLWVLMQMESSATAYNVPLHLELTGPLDRAAFARAFDALVARHESLRTNFVTVDGEPRQTIHDSLALAIGYEDLSAEPEPIAAARARGRAHAGRPFDLERDPLIRVALLRLGAAHHVVLLTLHHIVADGTSFGVLLREFAQLYAAFVAGEPDPLPPLALHYRDFAAWQNARLQGAELAPHRRYWHAQLGGELPVLELPADFPRPPVQTFRGRERAFALDRARLDGLHALAQQHHATLFMVLTALVKVLLHRHTAQTDLIVGSPIAGRGHPDLEQQVGFYLNTLALRDRLDPAQSFASFLRAVRQTTKDAFDHQIYPFDFLVNELPLKRDLSRSPLFDVLVVLQNQDERGRPIAGLTLTLFVEPSETAKLDLTFYFKALDDRLQGAIEFNADLFAPDRIARLAAQFATLVDAVLAAPATPIARLALLPAAERTQLLETFNRTAAPVEPGRTVVDLIEAQVAQTPGAIALTGGGEALTFAGLNARANQLAARLRELGAGPGALVGVCLERSPELVIALLAVLKTGAAYVPLDPLFPRDRLAFMLEDAGVRVLVTEPAVAGGLAPPGVTLLSPAEERTALARRPAADGPTVARPDGTAYVIYTSGSTGRPKGVPVLHRGLTNFLHSMQREPGLTAADTLLAVTTISFDIAGLELWLPLITGARIVLADRATAADGRALQAALQHAGATILQATPATWRLLLAAGWEGTPGLRMFCGGEALPGDLAAELLRRGAELWNLYGPTETTIWSTVHRVQPADAAPGVVTIGRPIANTQCHVLDAALEPRPIGVPGELHLGGEGVARGYWRRPELTAERFVPDPFAATPGARLYRTGDLARWRADGTLEYLGRLDHQVKVRGYRIELGEIEAALALHPAVRAAAAIVREDTPGDPLLAAYVVPRGAAPEPAELRAFLRERLPDYMVPVAWMTLAALPLTANGKVNRRALPAPGGTARVAGADYVAPRDATEAALGAIWAAVLGLPQVGVTASFFELGGHSLKAMQVLARVRAELGVELAMIELFREPTIAALATVLRARVPVPPVARAATADDVDREQPAPLSAAQRRLWILEQLRPGTAAYNMAEALRIEGALDVPALRAALAGVVARHEALRTVFPDADGDGAATVRPAAEFELAERDVSAASAVETAAHTLAAEEVARPFDLRTGPLFRATLIRLGAETHLLVCVMHHIVSDAWSVGVMMREFAGLYASRRAGRPEALPAPGAPYRTFAAWQQAELAGARGAAQRDYWLQQLGPERTVLALPTDAPRPAVMTAAGRTLVFQIEPALAAGLTRLGREAGATPFMTLLALVKTLLHRYTGQEDIVVGCPVAGRERVEWEGTVGFFVNTVVLRDRVARTENFSQLLGRVRATCLDAFAHQAYPFDRLVDDLKLERDLSRNPLFDVSVQLLAAGRTELTVEGLRLTEFDHGQSPAKCDLSFDFTEGAGGFTCALTYQPGLFSAARMQRLAEHLRQLAAAVVAAPGRALADHALLTAAERRQILVDFNPPPGAPARDTLTGWFERVAARQPAHPALRFEAETWTYAELESRANRLAHFLRARGVAEEAVVAVMLERGPALPCALLAVLKAGGVYLPVDPALPRARIAAMLADSGAQLVLAARAEREAGPDGVAILGLEEAAAELAARSPAPVPGGPAPADGAYLIYTSGSTGTPKGVLVEHRGLVNTIADQVRQLGLGPADRILQFSSASFDASLFEIFNALLSGATLVLARRETLTDPAAFLALLRGAGVTMAVLPPAFVRTLERRELPLRILFTAGEAAVPADARHYASRLTYVNGYGPTEASICSTVHFVAAEEAAPAGVPIGRPLANTRAYLLDARGQPVPIGVTGELWVGGAGVARGYWRRPELTAERFTADPWADEPGARRYRTGDLGRWREDGTIEFLGREDAQIKLRGYRIEPGEVEAALAQCPGVREAAVILREDVPGRPQLVGYVVAAATPPPDADTLRAHLRAILPDYMIPAAFVTLPALARSTAGKIDRRALPAPAVEAAGAAPVAPRDEVEQALARIFGEVLHRERVGVQDGFFHLGGDSLLAIRVISRVRDVFKIEVAVPVLFENPSVAALAAALRSNEATRSSVEKVARALARLAALSPEEKQRLLAQKRAAAASPAGPNPHA
jgi:amino acid adenylation domain-containing protein